MSTAAGHLCQAASLGDWRNLLAVIVDGAIAIQPAQPQWPLATGRQTGR